MPLCRVTDIIHSACVYLVSIMQRMHVNELEIMNKVMCGLISCTILRFVSRDWGKAQELSVGQAVL